MDSNINSDNVNDDLSKYDKIRIKRRFESSKNYDDNFHYYLYDLVHEDSLIRHTFSTIRVDDFDLELEKGTTVLIVNPILRKENLMFGLDLLKSEAELDYLYTSFQKIDSVGGISIDMLSSRELTESELGKFNDLSNIKIWFSECAQHLYMDDFITLESDYTQSFVKKNDKKYVCFAMGEYKNDRYKDGSSKYTIGVFDLKTGQLKCSTTKLNKSNYSSATFIKEFKETMWKMN